MPAPKFEVVDESSEQDIPAHTLDTLLMGLKALPQRMAFALSSCFALLTVATVFVLAWMIVPYAPTLYQLIGLAGYALFVLAVNVISRRR